MKVKKLTSLIIEPTNFCNLNCRMCPTNSEMKRKKGYMSLDLLKKTINGGKSLEHICFHNWGEPILNKDLFAMIRYAHSRKIKYTVFNTNGTHLNDHVISKIIESPLNILRISVDGTPETYQQIRGISFKAVEKNILNLIEKRDKKKSSLEIGIVMTVDEQTNKDVDCFYGKWSKIVDHIRFQPKLIRSLRTEFCPELFGKDYGNLVVLYDGKVIPCCVDYEGELVVGNILDESVDSIWNGLAIRRLRKRHLKKDFPKICKNCNEFDSQRAKKRFII